MRRLGVFVAFGVAWSVAGFSLAAQNDDDVVSRHAQAASEAMAAANYTSAEEHYRAIVHLRPDMPEAEMNLGLSLFLQKKYEPATHAFDAALKLNPGLVNARLFAGISRFNLNHPAAAAPYLLRYTEAKPSDLQGQFYLGLSYLELDKYQDAERALKAASRIDPRNVDILYHLAQSFLAQAKADPSRREAMAREYERTLEQIAAIDPTSYRLLQIRAGVSELEGNKAEAVRELEGLLKNDPRASGIHYSLGCLYLEAREYQKARAQFQAELGLERPYPRTWLQLGHVYVALQMPREAIPALQRALEVDPASSGLVWLDMAHAYRSLNEPEKSIAAFEKAIQLGQRGASIYYQLASMQKKAGHEEDARRNLAISEKLRNESDQPAASNPQ
jgi:tetratricopeptide (TPR) repeat protein